ncbi:MULTISPECIES: TetR/AcrR family transcriptional regulator [Bacillales]|uniref:TetR family transcriptional regulator n=1 Tax=Brevibacillus aydinogluensis TaxID=927786 RepID=A0AA48M3S6_9BACL|nr:MULTISPECIES: TetR/AcrR family transcriptional regulator [Bacillales]REK60797.1 MAG: TetR family transcriptional regulator [Brevibacillus sp.]MBR8660947.1 TetR/AcrR family transcriptional regulator [Brevibacillus sp. NL20B1]MDT3416226.1 TetR/AcrR family transcriptional repressor of nem operon [Brevibacillus aydinogluensis]NNV01130.1 TetR/AcrR family transcriptional regulator [Brevibacillus sp. MCWH]UFJ62165.1 TetR/AcrR family transcriptional regulator [Anoxybacillus sediminis]
MRPKEFDPDDVVDAAMQVFWQRGYTATSIQDLVEGTELGRSSIYNAFGSKHELYKHTLRRYQELKASQIAVLSGPGSVKERVRLLLMDVVEEELGKEKGLGCMTANAALELASHDSEIAAIVAQNFKELESALYEAFSRAQENGEIASDKNARALSRFILNTIQGLRVLSKGYIGHNRRQLLLDVVDVAIQAL